MESVLSHKKVFIVEDTAYVRVRLIELLSGIEGLSIVGEAETPHAAIKGIFLSHPEYVVLDFQLLGGTGIEVLNAVIKKMPGIIFIVLSNHTHPMYQRMCVEAGAHFFFDKSTEFMKVRDAITQCILQD